MLVAGIQISVTNGRNHVTAAVGHTAGLGSKLNQNSLRLRDFAMAASSSNTGDQQVLNMNAGQPSYSLVLIDRRELRPRAD